MLFEPERRVLFSLAIKFVTGRTAGAVLIFDYFVSRQSNGRQAFAKGAAVLNKRIF